MMIDIGAVLQSMDPQAAAQYEQKVNDMVEHCHEIHGRMLKAGKTEEWSLLDCERGLYISVVDATVTVLHELLERGSISDDGEMRLLEVMLVQASKKTAFERFQKEVLGVQSEAN